MKKLKVWDGATRLFHWCLVIAFGLSAYSAFEDKFGIYADIHLWSGVTVLVLVSWRILWGCFGSETSRFSHFVKSPIEALKSAGQFFKKTDKHPIGHNPLGGYSVVLMLVLLLVQAFLGLFSSDDMFFEGPFAGAVVGVNLTEIHEVLGLALLYIVGVHIFVVLLYRLIKGLNLLLPMITGSVNTEDDTSEPKMRSQILALVSFLVCAGIAYGLIFGGWI